MAARAAAHKSPGVAAEYLACLFPPPSDDAEHFRLRVASVLLADLFDAVSGMSLDLAKLRSAYVKE